MRKITSKPFTVSLEILSDGSEYSGGPAIFLTIRRGSGFNQQNGPIGPIGAISTSEPTDGTSTKEEMISNDYRDNDCSYQHKYRYHDASIESVDDDIVARYSLTGIPSLTGRLSSDQSFKMLSGGAFRAIFLSSLVTKSSSLSYNNTDAPDPRGGNINSCFRERSNRGCIIRGASVGGIPALFLNLVQSGYPVVAPAVITSGGSKNEIDRNLGDYDEFSDSAPENKDDSDTVQRHDEPNNSKFGAVSIIGPDGTDDFVEGVLDTIFGNGRSRPSLRVCEVPSSSLGDEGANDSHCCWWEVYTDNYIRVWAQSFPNSGPGKGECDAEVETDDHKSTDSSSSSCDDESSSLSSSHDDDESTSSSDDDSNQETCFHPLPQQYGNNDARAPNESNSSGTNNNYPCHKNENGNQDISDHTLAYIVMILPESSRTAINKSRKRKQQSEEATKHERGSKRPYAFAILSTPLSSIPSKDVEQIPSAKCGNSHLDVGNQNHWDVLRTLPEEIISGDNRMKGTKENGPALLDFILHLDPLGGCCCANDLDNTSVDPGKVEVGSEVGASFYTEVPQYEITVPSWVFSANLVSHHLATFPDRIKGRWDSRPMIDGGILIRSQRRSRLLSSALPFAFPFINDSTSINSILENTSCKVMDQKCNIATGQDHIATVRTDIAWGLRSCTSVILNNTFTSMDDERAKVKRPSSLPFTFISRIKGILDRCKSHGFVSWEDLYKGSSNFNGVNELDVVCSYDFSRTVHSLECVYSGNRVATQKESEFFSEPNTLLNVDDNEINLDSDGDGDGNEVSLEENSPAVVNEENNVNLAASVNSDCRSIPHPDRSSPHLLVLGTGCATPAPLRGSSAYGLMMPTMTASPYGDYFSNTLVLSAIIECGEGTLTSLHRHLPLDGLDPESDASRSRLDMQLRHVGFVWISHAHLDHYGDLPNVVQAITNAKRVKWHETRFGRREQNTEEASPLLVIAPKKVLKYLDIVMRVGPRTVQENSFSHRPRQRCLDYVGVSHREFEFSPFAEHARAILYQYNLLSPRTQPSATNSLSSSNCLAIKPYRPFALLRHVEVEHCREAFAMILELRYADDGVPNSLKEGSNFVLCFSGDTRPSSQLVRRCRSYPTSQNHNILGPHHYRRPPSLSQPWPPPSTPPQISLLIHESTFLNDSQGRADAIRKRHSTTAEALDVARQINAKACLLSHFSQRYRHVSIHDAIASPLSSSSVDHHNESADPMSSSAVIVTKNMHPFHWGIALDGMMIPLTHSGLSTLFHLSQCVDALMGLNSENPGHLA